MTCRNHGSVGFLKGFSVISLFPSKTLFWNNSCHCGWWPYCAPQSWIILNLLGSTKFRFYLQSAPEHWTVFQCRTFSLPAPALKEHLSCSLLSTAKYIGIRCVPCNLYKMSMTSEMNLMDLLFDKEDPSLHLAFDKDDLYPKNDLVDIDTKPTFDIAVSLNDLISIAMTCVLKRVTYHFITLTFLQRESWFQYHLFSRSLLCNLEWKWCNSKQVYTFHYCVCVFFKYVLQLWNMYSSFLDSWPS